MFNDISLHVKIKIQRFRNKILFKLSFTLLNRILRMTEEAKISAAFILKLAQTNKRNK